MQNPTVLLFGLQEAGRPLYRNTFSKGSADGGRWFNPLDLKFKNVANTGVIFWAGKLLALWEVRQTGCTLVFLDINTV